MSKKQVPKRNTNTPKVENQTIKKLNAVFSSTPLVIFSFVLLGITLFFYFNAIEVPDTDVWWHLKYGEHYFQNRTWHIDHSMFSWTPADAHWIYSTWLGSLALYVIYLAGGINGLLIFKWAIPAMIFAIFLLFVKITGRKFSVVQNLLLLLTAVVFGLKIVLVKPDSFTFLFFTMAVFIHFASRIRSKPYYYLYPILFLIWVNMHGGFSIGLLYITLAFVFETIAISLKKTESPLPRGYMKWFGLSVIASYAVTVINPHGILYPFTILKFVFFAHDPYLTNIQEYSNMWTALGSSVVTSNSLSAWSLAGMMIIFLLTAGYIFHKKHSIDLPIAAINGLFFLFSMSLSRATIFFPIVFFFSFIYLVHTRIPMVEKTVSAAAFVTLIGISSLLLYEAAVANTDPPFSLKLKPFLRPEKEVDYLLKNNLPAPLFNDYTIGGYLIWRAYPQYKVFIDPRYGPYRNADFWDAYWTLFNDPTKENLAALESKRRFNTAIIFSFNRSLSDAFYQSPEWKLIYFDEKAAIFIHISQIKTVFANNPILDIDLTTKRFDKVNNAATLYNLFCVYRMVSYDSSKKIRNLYDKKVRGYYRNKKEDLELMDDALASMKQGK